MSNNTQDLRRFVSVLDRQLERYLILSLYVYIVLIVGLEVFRRFVLDSASLWGSETARFMYIYITWIGASWGVRKRLHIRIDVIHRFLPERAVGGLYVLGDLVMIAFAALAVRWTIPQLQTLVEFGAVTSALRVSQIYFQIAIPIGMALLVVRTLQMLVRDIRDIRAGRPVDKGGELFA